MSLEKCIEIVNQYGHVCPRPLGIQQLIGIGHVVSTILRCRDYHRCRWLLHRTLKSPQIIWFI